MEALNCLLGTVSLTAAGTKINSDRAGAVQEMDTERLVRVIVGVMWQLQRQGQLPSPAPAAPIQLELPSWSSSSSMPPAVLPLTMGPYFPPTMGGVGAMTMMPGIPQPLGMMGVGVGESWCQLQVNLEDHLANDHTRKLLMKTPGPDGPLSLWHLEGLSDSEAQRLFSEEKCQKEKLQGLVDNSYYHQPHPHYSSAWARSSSCTWSWEGC